MGLLAPLYALAALAIAAPLLFHLIRRQPRGQFEFSSLMFLQASPPRITRRSRLDNLLLLLLRATALALIALAFARPFLRSVEFIEASAPGRELLLIVDTSGSMQRPDVWQRAIKTATDIVDGLGDRDRIGLATLDTELNVIIPLPDAEQMASSSAKAEQLAVREELTALKPTYRSTHLAEQLMAAAEIMQARKNEQASNDAADAEIVLVSDFHEASELDELQGFAWPESLRLDVRRVAPKKPGNARGSLMQAAQDRTSRSDSNQEATPDENVVRIRVENNASSTESAFSLQWVAAPGSTSSNGSPSSTQVQVTPGQARVIPVALPADTLNQLVLTGDEADFDNVIFVPRTAPRNERVGFIGRTPNASEDDLFFFLKNVPLSTPIRNVICERIKVEDLKTQVQSPDLAALVVECPFPDSLVPELEQFAQSGRPIVVVLSEPLAANSKGAGPTADSSAKDTESVLTKLFGTKVQIAQEPDTSASGGFALLTDIDFRHPLFQPLADSKFNDFGKVRFWSHRAVVLPEWKETDGTLQVLARFDDHSPALIHRNLGRGDLWLLGAGWQSTASQLALSTKFVPLLFGMLDPKQQSLQLDAVYEVGERIDSSSASIVTITKMDGTPVRNEGSKEGIRLEQPGIYWLNEDGKKRQVAVVLPASESQLDPLDIERFAQYGVVLGKSESNEQRQSKARLSQVTELEGKQKLWRWILVVAVGFLLLETWIASRSRD